jgi:hypothetical protein
MIVSSARLGSRAVSVSDVRDVSFVDGGDMAVDDRDCVVVADGVITIVVGRRAWLTQKVRIFVMLPRETDRQFGMYG